MRMVGWPERAQHGEIGDAGHLGEHVRDLIGGFLERLQIVAVDLDGILALDARGGLLDVVLDVLREIEVDARKLLRAAPRSSAAVSLSLSMPRGPGVEGLERHEEFGIEEAGGIGAVVRPAVLRDHRLHLGILARSARACD